MRHDIGLALVPAMSWLAVADVPLVMDARDLSGPAWSPYIVGGLIGALVWFTLMFSKQAVGASSAYAMMAGLIGRRLAPRRVGSLKYFKDHPPELGWELWFILATVVGACIAAWTGGELAGEWLSPMWVGRFGENSIVLRSILAFAGGVLMALGARTAQGCTSGHGISGALQLNVGSWISLLCFFAGGVLVAKMLYGF